MSRLLTCMPDPCLRRMFPAGEELRVGSLVEFRRDPNDRRQWKLYAHSVPGGNHLNLFVGESTPGQEWVEEGAQAYVVQYFGRMEVKAILRAGEKVSKGSYRHGGTGGLDLVSAGDGTGALLASTRFQSYGRSCGQSMEDVDLTESSEDQIITIRTHVYSGEVAEVG
jgi:hypothetical protein